jgi:hypothetical protein
MKIGPLLQRWFGVLNPKDITFGRAHGKVYTSIFCDFGGITEEADTSKNTLIWLIATNNIKWIFREL